MQDSIDGYRLDNGLKQLLHGMKDEFLGILKEKGLKHDEKELIRLNKPVAEIKNGQNPTEIIT